MEGQNILEICNNIVRRPLTTFAFPKKFFVQQTFIPIRLFLHSFKTLQCQEYQECQQYREFQECQERHQVSYFLKLC